MFKKKINKFFKFSIDELILIIFPLSLVIGSALVNFLLIFASIVSIFKFYKKNLFLKRNDLIILSIIGLFIFTLILKSILHYNEKSLTTSISQLRFLFFFLYLISIDLNKLDINKVFIIYKIICYAVSLDLILQSFYGKNIIGLSMPQGTDRFSGFFGDEWVAGGFLFILSFPLIAQNLLTYKKKNRQYKFEAFFFLIIILIGIIQSGDRMPLLLMGFGMSILVIYQFNLKEMFKIFTLLSILILFLVNLSDNFLNRISTFQDHFINGHYKLFKSSYILWQNDLFLGVGVKNFKNKCLELLVNRTDDLLCSSHPHNIILQLLSETGLIGLFMFCLIFILMFRQINFKNIIKTPYLFGFFLLLCLYLWPLRSSGSIFSTWYASTFWFSAGLTYLLTRGQANYKKKV